MKEKWYYAEVSWKGAFGKIFTSRLGSLKEENTENMIEKIVKNVTSRNQSIVKIYRYTGTLTTSDYREEN